MPRCSRIYVPKRAKCASERRVTPASAACGVGTKPGRAVAVRKSSARFGFGGVGFIIQTLHHMLLIADEIAQFKTVAVVAPPTHLRPCRTGLCWGNRGPAEITGDPEERLGVEPGTA